MPCKQNKKTMALPKLVAICKSQNPIYPFLFPVHTKKVSPALLHFASTLLSFVNGTFSQKEYHELTLRAAP